jgi:LmbE family N-acetylglucosaminyl deacetylase
VDASNDPIPATGYVPSVVLAVYAHPDDPEVSCAGTLSKWSDAGAQVHLIICARGDKGSRDPTTDPVALAAVRAGEAAAAAAVMGLASQSNLGRSDGEVVNDLALRGELVERIRTLRPDVVMGPDPSPLFFGSSYVNHIDHREVGSAVLDACAPASASPLYFPDAGPAHSVDTVYLSGTLEPDTHVDISAVLERKVEALLCHRSQIDDPDEVAGVIRRRALAAGEAVGLGAAESFRVLHPR